MFKLEDHLKNAVTSEEIAGVYWCGRDMDPSPVGNHHFLAFIYKNEEQAKKITQGWNHWDIGYRYEINDNNLIVYYSTMGVGKGNEDNIKFTFNSSSDLWGMYEIAKDSNRSIFRVDKDLMGHNISHLASDIDFSDDEELMNSILQLIFNFMKNYNNGYGIEYELVGPNCATGVNSILAYLGYSNETRVTLGDFSLLGTTNIIDESISCDWGEEDLIPESYFTVEYIGNNRSDSMELHCPWCDYVPDMNDDNKVLFASVLEAKNSGYNGCYYCMNEIDTDSYIPPNRLFKLHLKSLLCNSSESFLTADRPYICVNNIRVFGPSSLNNGEELSLADIPPFVFYDHEVNVSLYDQDTGYQITENPLFDIVFDANDFLGEEMIAAEVKEGTVSFNRDGADYILAYEILEYDINSGVVLEDIRYRLVFDSLVCNETEDWCGADEVYLRGNNSIIWGPVSMNDGDVVDLSEIEAILFRGSVNLSLYDQDGSVPGDDDDFLGSLLVDATDSDIGLCSHIYSGDGANYRLRYYVEKID